MKTRILTGIAFTVAILAFLVPGFLYRPVFILCLFAIVSLVGGNEMYKSLRLKFDLPMQKSTFFYRLSIFLPLLFYFFIGFEWKQALLLGHQQSGGGEARTFVFMALASYGFFALVVLLYSLFFVILTAICHGPKSLTQSTAMVAGNLYLAFPLATVPVFLYYVPQGGAWIVLAMFSPWASDVCAYFAGYFFGRKKLIPQISPKKTYAGFYGGMIGSVLLAIAFFARMNFASTSGSKVLLWGLVVGIGLSLASQLGDWIASVIKRELELKDFGNLLPGHGGILDRFDSVLFTLPLSLVLALIFTLW